MAKLVFSMNQSLDGYVDHMAFAPGPTLFRHFIDQVTNQAAGLYGRHVYGLMRYWEEEQPDWGADEHALAVAWRRLPIWVASTTLQSVGPNATLVSTDLADTVRRLTATHDGEIAIAGPCLARSLGGMGLIDEYRIYLHPVVLGGGTPYFAAARTPLRLVGSEQVDGDVLCLRYAPR